MSILDAVLRNAEEPSTDSSWAPGKYVKRKCSNGRTYILRLKTKEDATIYWPSEVVISPGHASSYPVGAEFSLDETNEINELINIGRVCRLSADSDIDHEPLYFEHKNDTWFAYKNKPKYFGSQVHSFEKILKLHSDSELIDPPDWLLLKLC